MLHDHLDVLSEKLGLTEKIWQIFDSTEFNNQPLLNGSVNNQVYSVGDGPEQVIPITIDNVGSIVSDLKERIDASIAKKQETGSQETVDTQVEIIDHAIGSVTRVRTTLDSLQNRFEEAINNLNNTSKNTAEVISQVLDEAFVEETAIFARDIIIQRTDISIITQANQQPQVAMKLLE